MSLRTRLFAGVLLVAVVLGVTAVLVTSNTRSHLVDQIDRQLAAVEDPLRGRGPDMWGHDAPGPLDAAPQLSSFYVGVLTSTGSSVTVSTPNAGGDDSPAPVLDADAVRSSAESGEPFTTSSSDPDVRYRVLASPRSNDGSLSIVALPLTDVDDAVSRLVVVEVVATVVVLTVLAIVTWWVLHLGVRPVKRMTAAASAIASGDLSARVPEADARTEAGELGVALNQMLGRIESAFDDRTRSEERLRQFVADASHELRTPLTTIRGYAELYRAGALDKPDDLREAMRRTEQEAVRVGALVDDMLQLARLDQGRPLEHEPIDLAALADDAARDARAVDSTRAIASDADGPLVVLGDEHRLRQVLANLVANALVHTPDGTPIELHARRDGDVAVLDVVDHGQGMPSDVARRAFERFFRADPSRSRHQGGSGLGLAIVEATITAHGGRVGIDSVVGSGTAVRVELPLASAPAVGRAYSPQG